MRVNLFFRKEHEGESYSGEQTNRNVMLVESVYLVTISFCKYGKFVKHIQKLPLS